MQQFQILPTFMGLKPDSLTPQNIYSAITPLFDSDICQFYVPPSLPLLTSSNTQEDPAWAVPSETLQRQAMYK